MTARRHAPRSRPGDRLVVAGGVVFGAGVAFVAAVFVPFLLGDAERGLPLSLATFLTVAGLALVLIGLFRQGRRRPGPPVDGPG